MGQSQDERIGVIAGAQHPLGRAHGELAHRLDLGAHLHAIHDQAEVLRPVVERRWLVLPGDAPPVEARRQPGLQLALEGHAARLGDDGGLLGTQRTGNQVGCQLVEQDRGSSFSSRSLS